ncbi:hypothetical protein [Neobacillus ginsengisoli]|uniref:Aspartyl-phosphate phosphatase Spo0E family protein n=1 Tax=Neobacillus ginsengisoli TaxID=904295 RepID=A0ABT9Y207_9BACI|nr:hypothetical protein [Neobacillus ginsengisoli]MDQ0201179.1 hypothetical protein [Neobacillus ginsengisoli]
MGKESNCNLDGINKDVLKQMELKRREIISNISDLPPSKKEIAIKNLDRLIILLNKPHQ